MHIILHTTEHPISLSCDGNSFVNDVESNTLRVCIVILGIMYFFLLVVMTFKLILFVMNLLPSTSRISWMVLYNLLPDAFLMLLLENHRIVIFTAFFYQLY